MTKGSAWPQQLLRVLNCRSADWLIGIQSFLGWTSSSYFEVVWNEELGRPEEVEDVAEHVSVPVNEVVLLQAVQDYRLCTIEEATNSAHKILRLMKIHHNRLFYSAVHALVYRTIKTKMNNYYRERVKCKGNRTQ